MASRASAEPRRSECTLHHIAAADVLEQRADGDRLRGDGDVDAAALHELRIGGLVDQRHDLAGAQALGEHGGENVGLFGVGERREHVRAVDVLLDQQLLIGRIAVQHDGVFQQLRDAPRALARRAR